MKATKLAIPDVMLLEPIIFADDRGFFFESFNQRVFNELTNQTVQFVQSNHSKSIKNVVRGLHYQLKQPQGKLIRVISGAIFDVAVDIRQSSPTFGQWVTEIITAEDKKQIWIPVGFAHGFAVLSDVAEVLYQTTAYWSPEDEHCIAWDDASLAIPWPIEGNIRISSKDNLGIAFNCAQVFA